MYDLQGEWKNTKKLVQQGYKILNKCVILNIPAPCLPADSIKQNTGIGSPISRGGKRFFDFFEGVFDKILFGPTGRTFAPKYSPYESAFGQNPFFIDLYKLTTEKYGKLLSVKTLHAIYNTPKDETDIFFPMLGRNYNDALFEAYQNYLQRLAEKNDFALLINQEIKKLKHSFTAQEATFYAPFAQDRYLFEEALTTLMLRELTMSSIADVEVKMPDALVIQKPYLFLTDFTLGSPPDKFNQNARDWNFKVFNPDYLINPDGSLGEAGEFLFKTFDNLFQNNTGGIRIDHFIGFVNPYVFAHNKNDKSGRLYSSDDNPMLSRFAKKPGQFGDLVEKTIIAAMKKNKQTVMNIYPEDLGARPEQLDDVLKQFGLGHLIVCQFADVNNPQHFYHLSNTTFEDIAALDTHDTQSIQTYLASMDDYTRQKDAKRMAQYLRFNYNDSLKDNRQLMRMKWAELMTCPAHRTQAFFTSFIGLDGRYNEPGNPKKWRLRCPCDFENIYFNNILNGTAYNPLDAIALAIFARGDDFYNQNKNFVAKLHDQENKLIAAIREQFSK